VGGGPLDANPSMGDNAGRAARRRTPDKDEKGSNGAGTRSTKVLGDHTAGITEGVDSSV
jgi:hypothetical protein